MVQLHQIVGIETGDSHDGAGAVVVVVVGVAVAGAAAVVLVAAGAAATVVLLTLDSRSLVVVSLSCVSPSHGTRWATACRPRRVRPRLPSSRLRYRGCLQIFGNTWARPKSRTQGSKVKGPRGSWDTDLPHGAIRVPGPIWGSCI